MSPPPAGEQPASPYESKRPKALTVVCVIGIIFGSMGVTCVCLGLAGALLKGGEAQLQGASLTELMIQIATSVAGLIISLFLIIACVGALGLRFWAGTMMIVVNIVNLIFETAKLVLSLVWGVSKSLAQMQNPPPDATAQQMEGFHKMQPYLAYIRVGMYVLVVVLFLIQVVYSVSVLMVMKRPDVKAALAGPNLSDPPASPMM